MNCHLNGFLINQDKIVVTVEKISILYIRSNLLEQNVNFTCFHSTWCFLIEFSQVEGIPLLRCIKELLIPYRYTRHEIKVCELSCVKM